MSTVLDHLHAAVTRFDTAEALNGEAHALLGDKQNEEAACTAMSRLQTAAYLRSSAIAEVRAAYALASATAAVPTPPSPTAPPLPPQ